MFVGFTVVWCQFSLYFSNPMLTYWDQCLDQVSIQGAYWEKEAESISKLMVQNKEFLKSLRDTLTIYASLTNNRDAPH